MGLCFNMAHIAEQKNQTRKDLIIYHLSIKIRMNEKKTKDLIKTLRFNK